MVSGASLIALTLDLGANPVHSLCGLSNTLLYSCLVGDILLVLAGGEEGLEIPWQISLVCDFYH